jgi:hypothetical protein
VLSEVVDSPGGDVGSPGFVPGVVTTLNGDYSGNGVVDAADYVLWRYAMKNSTALAHDTTPESVSAADYQLWRANFGKTGGTGSGQGSASVPEPGLIGFVFALAVACGVRSRPAETAGLTI